MTVPDVTASSQLSNGLPLQPSTTPTMPTTGGGLPGFYQNPLYQYHDPAASTNATFNSAIQAATPSTGISPQYQQILDSIQKQQDYANGVSAANASSLAAKRGLAGSSIEQFGVQQGLAQNSQAAQGAIQSTLSQNATAQNALQTLQAQLYGNRATSLAGLGSDETASLRNADYANNSLALQQSLGQQGINLGYANIGAQQQLGQQQATNNLLSSGASILAPYLFGGSGGGLPGLFGSSAAGGAGAAGTAGAFTPYAAGGTVGPYAYGGSTAAAGFTPGLGAIGAAGVGSMILANQGQKIAGQPGAFFANPIGAQLNLAKNALSSGGNVVSNVGNTISNGVSAVTNTVSNVFPF